MRIVFAGTPELAAVSLRALVDAGADVVGVLTRADAPLGRKRVLTPSPVAQLADDLGIPVRKANRPGEDDTAWVRALGADMGVVVAYGAILKQDLLDTPRHGWINLHFSALPRWRGAAPVQRALMQGEWTIGLSVFRLVPELDAGDVLVRNTHTFEVGTSAGTALDALARIGSDDILTAVNLITADPGAGEPQTGEVTYAHKLTREDGKLDPTSTTAQFIAHWAGVTPEPGAFVCHEGAPLKLHEVSIVANEMSGNPGTVSLIGGAAVLTTADGAVVFETVQPAGKPRMTGDAWLRGRDGEAVVS